MDNNPLRPLQQAATNNGNVACQNANSALIRAGKKDHQAIDMIHAAFGPEMSATDIVNCVKDVTSKEDQ